MTGAQWHDWPINESVHWRERQDVLASLTSCGDSSDRGYHGNGKWAVIRGEKRGQGEKKGGKKGGGQEGHQAQKVNDRFLGGQGVGL